MTSIDRVKTHLKNNKKVYLVGAGSLALGVAATAIIMRNSALSMANSSAETAAKVTQFNFKSNPITNIVTVNMPEMSTPSNIVQRLEDGTVWRSQNEAAQALGVSAAHLCNHLRGRAPSVNGEHFHVIPREAVV